MTKMKLRPSYYEENCPVKWIRFLLSSENDGNRYQIIAYRVKKRIVCYITNKKLTPLHFNVKTNTTF